jgi:hypothetical protein
MGKVNKLHHVVALTREMTVEYLKPVPLHTPPPWQWERC